MKPPPTCAACSFIQPEAFLSIAEVAEKLHITERTLRRRLTAEGTNFRTIFDDIKNTLARNYLSKTSLSVVEIADLSTTPKPPTSIEPSNGGIRPHPPTIGSRHQLELSPFHTVAVVSNGGLKEKTRVVTRFCFDQISTSRRRALPDPILLMQ
jgi:hypothetical protein